MHPIIENIEEWKKTDLRSKRKRMRNWSAFFKAHADEWAVVALVIAIILAVIVVAFEGGFWLGSNL